MSRCSALVAAITVAACGHPAPPPTVPTKLPSAPDPTGPHDGRDRRAGHPVRRRRDPVGRRRRRDRRRPHGDLRLRRRCRASGRAPTAPRCSSSAPSPGLHVDAPRRRGPARRGRLRHRARAADAAGVTCRPRTISASRSRCSRPTVSGCRRCRAASRPRCSTPIRTPATAPTSMLRGPGVEPGSRPRPARSCTTRRGASACSASRSRARPGPTTRTVRGARRGAAPPRPTPRRRDRRGGGARRARAQRGPRHHPPWHLDALVGAGGLHSTARDLLAVLRAEIDAAHGGQGPLADRLRATQEVRVAADPALGRPRLVDREGRPAVAHRHLGRLSTSSSASIRRAARAS